jgi:signal transduction histidine kinase
MDQSVARRDALAVFRLVIVIRLAFLGLIFLAIVGMGGSARLGLLLRASPTLLLAVLFLPSWLEPVLGRYLLMVGLGLDVFFSSLETAYLSTHLPVSRLAQLGVPVEVVQHIAAIPTIEPFFFLLIPLVLLAWGYGRRGALLGSTWASVLHLAIGLWVLPTDSQIRLFFVQATVRVALLYLVPFIISVLAEREWRQLSQLEVAHQRLRRHAATVEQLAISRERNRLARDLHDTLAHSLSALTVQLQALRTLLANDPDSARELVNELLTLARRGLGESRQAIQSLRADPVQLLGLEGALRDMVQSFQARTGVQASLSVAGQDLDPTVEEAQALFRIAEEALTNVERHASAQQVTLLLVSGADWLDLVIRDDGVGFDPTAADPKRYGLTGMQERAAIIGATLEVKSRPGAGSEVWCSLKR